MRPFKLAPVLLAIGVMACDWVQPASSKAQAAAQPAPAPAAPRATPTDAGQMQLSFSAVSKKASPAVVNVYAQRVVRGVAVDPFWRQFGLNMGVPQERVQQSLGSGVIVRADGVIVTNHHVVDQAQAMKVVLSDRREFDAKLILDDPQSDLAVLRIDTKGERLPTLAFADTHKLEVGDLVIAIGNPFGLSQTVTNGIISAVGRTGVGNSGYGNYIQTDAAINSGNSGGALVDMNSDLIGINTMILSPSGTSAGIGFAIPSDMVQRVVESAIAGGQVVRPWLGVKGQAVTQDTARSLGLPSPRGVLVAEVYPGSPAARAGLVAGDVILTVGGVEVFDEAGVRYQAATARPGSNLALDVIKGTTRRTITARAEAPPRTPAPDVRVMQGRIPLDGAQIATLSPAEANDVGFDPMTRGVYIKAMARAGIAAQLGLAPGDIIVSVNGKAINTSADLDAAMKGVTAWHIEFLRNGQLRTIDV